MKRTTSSSSAFAALALLALGSATFAASQPAWTTYDTNGATLMGSAADTAGQLHITGFINPANAANATTIKYNLNGTLAWSRSPAITSNNLQNFGKAIALDSQGNTYVAMDSFDPDPSKPTGTYQWNIKVIKYNSLGAVVWPNPAYFTTSHGNYAMRIAVDSLGNTYVVGETDTSGPTSHPVLVKFSASGGTVAYNGLNNGVVWSKTGTTTGIGTKVAVDSADNVVMAGNSGGVAKYNSSGGLIWTNAVSGGGVDAMTLDPGGNPIIAATGGMVPVGGVLQKLNSATGTAAWTVNGSVSPPATWLMSFVAVDSSSNIFVLGSSQNFSGGGAHITVRKYSSAGVQLGPGVSYSNASGVDTLQVATSGLSQNAYGNQCIAVDTKGNVFVQGVFTPNGPSKSSILTIKYSASSLTQIWDDIEATQGAGNSICQVVADNIGLIGGVYSTGSSLDPPNGSPSRYVSMHYTN